MASFTDRIETFTPYRPEFPVEAALMVGTQKEEQFLEGIRRVQGDIDTLHGFDIMKPETRQYLEGKIGEMRNVVNNISGDFSDQRLINGIGALRGRISNDSVVQNGLASTALFRKGISEIEKAKQEGKGSPENEWDFQNEAMKWLNDKDYTSKFSHRYTPYVDVRKKVMDVIKTLDPETLINQNPFITDAKGNIMVDEATGLPALNYDIIEKHYKGKSADRIANAIMASLDNNDLRQLEISGRYTYRNTTPEQLQGDIADHYKNQKLSIVNAIAELGVEKIIGGDAQTQRDIDESIKGYENQLKLIDQAYTSDLNGIATNPDGVKGKLYRNSFINSISSAFKSEERWTKYLDNPAFNNFMEKKRFEMDQWWKKEELEFKYFQEQNDMLKAAMSASGKSKTGSKGENELSYEGVSYPVRADLPTPTETSFRDETNALEDRKYETMENIIKTYAGDAYDRWQQVSVMAANTADAQGNVSGKPLNKRSFLEAQFKKLKRDWDANKEMPQAVEEQLANIAQIDKEVETRHRALYSIKTEADKQIPGFTAADINKKVAPVSFNIGTTTYQMSPDDIVNVAIFEDEMGLFQSKLGKERYNQARQQLINKFGEDFVSKISIEGRIRGGKAFKDSIKAATELVKSTNYEARRDYITDQLVERGLAGKPVQYGINIEADADRNRVKTFLMQYADEAARTGTNTHPDFSRGKLTDAFASSKGFTANIVRVPSTSKYGEDFYEVTIDDLAKNEKTKMTLTEEQAEQLTGRDFTKAFSKIEDRIRFSQNGTTNFESPSLSGDSHIGAFLDKTNFPNVSLPIKADVAQSTTEKGKYFITIYTQDGTGEWVAKEARVKDASGKAVRTAMTIEQVEQFLLNLNDTTVNYLFK